MEISPRSIRAENDITPWVEYFTEDMGFALEKVVALMITS
jgi:hypothetical protein